MSELYFIEKAASSDLATCENIMRRIYDENPSHWPYGLNAGQLKGGLYMVREASTRAPVGFVGWQEENQGLRKVGYYSIGILPEYRRRGWAKSAVRQIIQTKAAGVDEVRAMVHRTNTPSLELARQLDVPIEKVAMEKRANPLRFLRNIATKYPKTWAGAKAVGAGGATAGGVDLVAYKDDGVVGLLKNLAKGQDTSNFDPASLGDFGLNAALGGYAPFMPTTMGQIALPTLAQATTIGFGVNRNDRTTHDIGREQNQISGESNNTLKNLGYGALALGVPALGLAAYNAFKPRAEEEKAEAAQEQITRQAQGKIRITLPTKNPGDKETEIELPFDADTINMSNALQGSLGRDIRRRLRDEAKTRIRRRGEPIYNSALHALN